MRYLLTLAAAASLLAACHNRSEDEVGAAPDRGDTTAVAADTTAATPTDSTMGQMPSDTSAMGADTTAAPTTDTTSMGAPTDTTSAGGYSDTTSATPTDTTSAQPMDSTKQ
jgi:hypothetical protein